MQNTVLTVLAIMLPSDIARLFCTFSLALATLTGYSGYPALDCLKQNFCQCSQSIRVSTFLCIFGILHPNILLLSTSLVASVVEYIGTHAHQQSPCTRLSLIFTYSKSPLSLAFVECRRAYHIPTAAEGKCVFCPLIARSREI